MLRRSPSLVQPAPLELALLDPARDAGPGGCLNAETFATQVLSRLASSAVTSAKCRKPGEPSSKYRSSHRSAAHSYFGDSSG
jgi:hypothetical protein